MVKLPQTHLRTHVLTHRDNGDSQNGQALVGRIILFFVEVVVAVMKHRLDLEHVARSGVCAHVCQDRRLLRQRMRDRLQDLARRVGSILTTC